MKLSPSQVKLLAKLASTTREKPLLANISFFDRTARALRRRGLSDYRSYDETHGRGGHFITDAGREAMNPK